MTQEDLKIFIETLELTKQEKLFSDWIADFTGILKFSDRKKIIIKLKESRDKYEN